MFTGFIAAGMLAFGMAASQPPEGAGAKLTVNAEVARAVHSLNARAALPDLKIPGEDGMLPTQPGITSWTVINPGPVQRGCAIDVGVLAATTAAQAQEIATLLLGDSRVASATVVLISGVTPTVLEMQAFDSLLVVSNLSPLNNVLLGNNLATYIDDGGGVVLTMFCMRASSAARTIEGRFLTDNYYCIERTVGASVNGIATLGTIHVPSSPLVAGVTTFNGGTASFRTPAAPHPMATRIADWSTGQVLIASRSDLAGPRVDLGFLAMSETSVPGSWLPSTDGAVMLRNAAVAVSGCREECEADFNGDGRVNSQDFFDFVTAFFAGC